MKRSAYQVSIILLLTTLLSGFMHGNSGGGGGSSPIVQAAVFTPSTPATNGGAVGTATATNSPTGWSITAGDPSGDFAISSGGVITFTAQGQTDYSGAVSLKSATLTLQASNGAGSGSNNNTVNASADGSVNAPVNASIQHSAFFTSYARQSGQSAYTVRPAWKVAGVDYAVGPAANATITIASPAVVTETAHGHVAGEKVTFFTTGALPTGITAGTVEYFVLAAGLTTNTYEISTTSGGAAVNTSGTQSGFHSVFKDPSVDALPSTCTYSTTTANHVTCTSAKTFSYWYFNDALLEITGGCTTGTFLIQNSRFLTGSNTDNANYQFGQIENDGVCSTTALNNIFDNNIQNLANQTYNQTGFIRVSTTGAFLSQYNSYQNLNCRAFNFVSEPSSVISQYDYLEGTNYNNGCHGEFMILNGGTPTATQSVLKVNFTTALLPASFGGGYTAAWYFSGGVGATGYVITSGEYSYSVAATNLFAFNAQISGTTLTVNSTTANLIFGPCSVSALNNNILGSGVTANTSITACGSGTGGTGTYTVNNSQTVAAETMFTTMGGAAAVRAPGPVFTALNYTSNYVDPTGALFCFVTDTVAGSSAPVFTGNLNLLDGSTIPDEVRANCHGHN